MRTAGRVVDLTQPLGERTPLWPGEGPLDFDAHASIGRDGYFARSIRSPEHAGTHLDAPAHFDPAGRTVEAVAAERLVVPCAVIDARDRCAADPDTAIDAADLEAEERRHGELGSGSSVLLSTGWAERLGDAERFFGRADDDEAMSFPGFAPSAAELLIERGVVGVGTDTLSVDPGFATEFPVHQITLLAGLWHLEGLVNLTALPPRGALLFAGALRLEGGSGAPARVLALLPEVGR